MSPSRQLLDGIRALAPATRLRVMNVCGGHERALTMAGLRGVLPETIELIAGPGCPVCVCPEQDLHDAIAIALRGDVTLLAFGDLLRAPVNVARGEPRSLDEARAAGADIRPIASPAEAIAFARREPGRNFVFLAAGFETTMAPVAAMLERAAEDGGLPEHLSVLLAGRRTAPAVAMLLESGDSAIDALIAPGHVATVIGAEEWRFVPHRHHLPCAIAGFNTESLLAALLALLRQVVEGRRTLDNCYPESVRPDGNAAARDCLDRVMAVVDAEWRGIGSIPRSGYALRPAFAGHDARLRFPLTRSERRRAGAMPPGCDCAGVVLGRIAPDRCRLYGTACTPHTPIGPCMVSDEGACRIWWQAGETSNTNQWERTRLGD